MGFTVFNVNTAQKQVTRAEGTVLPVGTVEFMYWDLAHNIGVLPTIANTNATTASARLTLFFPTAFGVGEYELPSLDVEENEKKIVD